MSKSKILCSRHAQQRAKERFGWKINTLDRMANKAFYEGIKHEDTKGKLRENLDHKRSEYQQANFVRIHGEVAYFFQGHFLITVYRLNNKLIKHLKYLNK